METRFLRICEQRALEPGPSHPVPTIPPTCMRFWIANHNADGAAEALERFVLAAATTSIKVHAWTVRGVRRDSVVDVDLLGTVYGRAWDHAHCVG